MGRGTLNDVSIERKLKFVGGRFQWEDGVGVTVKVTREGVEVGCKTVSWEAWDELKRLVGDM